MILNNIGIIGMGVMGSNIAFNFSNHNERISVYTRSSEKLKQIVQKDQNNFIISFNSLKDFVFSLKKPRHILLMIPSGSSIDLLIESLLKFLDIGDVIIDGGNSFFKDTQKRNNYLIKKGIYFIGAGISGGEKGALLGPSIMYGGDKKACAILEILFQKISAKYHGQSCSEYIGSDGSGHYVKMVHNGIEYSDMQLISEVYYLLKNLLQFDNQKISNLFKKWNQGELCSYLIEITGNILSKKNKNGNYIIDLIEDIANNKGTGMWTSQNALELCVPLSLITESVFARYLSTLKTQRILASTLFTGPEKKIKFTSKELSIFLNHLQKALYLSKILSYAQGFTQLKFASEKYNWNLQYFKIAKIFRAGCIIRADLLNKIVDAYVENNQIISFLFSPYFQNIVNQYHSSLRYIVSIGVKFGISIPVFSAAISYYDSYRSKISSANLIQAQRDYFGSHTYSRIDKEGSFHTEWI
ncbi:6-phosphogluconate dehydrogenase,decarboxylating [Buchnera aphidicola (Tuberolachnus salignus)]|uniref:6-phosphogluconate dehydrogenase, decarboxylating n=1 Tax=Buchnera aphidicola subsp. Tuberolachnus salignus TaxID=98804 RepID=A0A160SWR1_BUCTT|nr:decarboxylating NADP(+)-dependent phosphogluconate dehydrogenase [Buchnera aphidicola]CUR53058.1 6-phosphogluconate dehydrogenase,decarboxylating [Buchnera aphidicola (Tuberolachnus salignus)]